MTDGVSRVQQGKLGKSEGFTIAQAFGAVKDGRAAI